MTRSFILAAALIAVALSACTDNMAPPCPSVRVDSTTAKLTKFKDGPGRDAADVAYQAEVVAYEGECVFSDEGVEVRMDLDFSVATGPAVTAGRESIFYFVAVPQLFPKAEGKQIFQFRADLPAAPGARERTRENNLRIFIPLQKNEPAASYDVYVGLQLTNEQLEYNRSQSP
ncbi:MAG: hypothetical protein SFV19_11560 [Rhodospirillaceae bacterium]|nr:hypothetical protein [Rhodospirillaceae bacterium]